jgi:hypothetical protein
VVLHEVPVGDVFEVEIEYVTDGITQTTILPMLMPHGTSLEEALALADSHFSVRKYIAGYFCTTIEIKAIYPF